MMSPNSQDRPLRSHGGPSQGSSKQQQSHLGRESRGPGFHSSSQLLYLRRTLGPGEPVDTAGPS